MKTANGDKNGFLPQTRREETQVNAGEKAMGVKYAGGKSNPPYWCCLCITVSKAVNHQSLAACSRGRPGGQVSAGGAEQAASSRAACPPFCLWSVFPIKFPFGKAFRRRKPFSGITPTPLPCSRRHIQGALPGQEQLSEGTGAAALTRGFPRSSYQLV